MDIIKQIKGSNASVRQLSILTGIPEDRMYKWVSGASNPKGDDISKLQEIFRQISDLSKGQIKELVHKLKPSTKSPLDTGNNDNLQEALQSISGNPHVRVEEKKPIDNQDDIKNNKDENGDTSIEQIDLDLLDTKPIPKMLKDLIALSRHNANVAEIQARTSESLARAKEKDSEAFLIMARSIDRLLAEKEGRERTNFGKAS